MDAPHTAVSLEQGPQSVLAPDTAPAGTEKLAQHGIEAAKDVAFGSAAGVVGKFIEYPFDTVKVRLQSSAQYTGPVDCFRQGWQQDGFSGLYRGISAPLVGAAVETSSLFFSVSLCDKVKLKTDG
jgi:ornithine carrier protein